jgi:hypothetical protein
VDFGVDGWHRTLIGASFLNLGLWLVAARGLRPDDRAPGSRLRAALLWLSAGYVLGCAYRSWWPVYDVPRIVVVDSALSSVAIGRSVATLAEMCLTLQCALVLRAVGRRWHSAGARRVAWALAPLVLLAEACSWHAVLTTSNLGHLLEESLWGLGAAAWTLALAGAWLGSAGRRAGTVAAWPYALCIATGLGYVLFMFGVDVPMYWARWVADEAAGRQYLSLAEGLTDVWSRRTVSTDWSHWRSEVVWMTMYFTVAVWLSIGLVHLPLPTLRRSERVPQAGASGDTRDNVRGLRGSAA